MARLDKRNGLHAGLHRRWPAEQRICSESSLMRRGTVWISTNMGPYLRTPGPRAHYEVDGIEAVQPLRILVLPDGPMFFDGMDGGTSFHRRT